MLSLLVTLPLPLRCGEIGRITFWWAFLIFGTAESCVFGCLGPSGGHHLFGRVELCRSIFFRAPAVQITRVPPQRKMAWERYPFVRDHSRPTQATLPVERCHRDLDRKMP